MQKGAHIKSARRCDLSQDAHTCVTNTRTEKQMTGRPPDVLLSALNEEATTRTPTGCHRCRPLCTLFDENHTVRLRTSAFLHAASLLQDPRAFLCKAVGLSPSLFHSV